MKFFNCFLIIVALAITQEVHGRGRMFLGYPVAYKQFAPLVRLDMHWSNEVTRCSGTVVGTQWVITAAHCVCRYDNATGSRIWPDFIIVHMGSPIQDVNETKITVQPGGNAYILPTYKAAPTDDIAMIQIPKGEIPPHVRSASINYTRTNYDNVILKVAGWGSLRNKAILPDVAQWNEFKVEKLSLCEKEVSKNGIYPGRQICLRNPNKASTCQGDSGGPAFFGNELIGVVSAGSGYGCEVGKPVIYSYLPYYKNFMKTVMNNYGGF